MLGNPANLKLGNCGTPPTPLLPLLSCGGLLVDSELELLVRLSLN
tara:strand:- start:392 stop:526 length:135 start_codon:yes stop_codon:yes gene_type:complete